MPEIVPIVDIFAGPGGLGEGFSRVRNSAGDPVFRIRLSVEMDEFAHRTLTLRAFFRQFNGRPPAAYYDYLRASNGEAAKTAWGALTSECSAEYADALRETQKPLMLGRDNTTIDGLVSKAVSSTRRKSRVRRGKWILIGGPPCQAYSLVGRSRMRPVQKSNFYKDKRHTLYEQYLRLLDKHRPTAFVMENVKGILSSTLHGERIFDRILEDLENVGYKLFAVARPAGLPFEKEPVTGGDAVTPGLVPASRASDYVVRAEDFGIPQARHRVVIVGVDRDYVAEFSSNLRPRTLRGSRTTVLAAIGDLPRLRSGLSEGDSHTAWRAYLCSVAGEEWLMRLAERDSRGIASKVFSTLGELCVPQNGRGGRFVRSTKPMSGPLAEFLADPGLGGACNHETRGHFDKDLQRYMFAACYADVIESSPRLGEFPDQLLPNHQNARTGKFDDRFRVQLRGEPSSTVTAHISKDGHYFIHYDPAQCRSLTVREAARLQTFPDNYFFEGPRTEQYRQVGNAVPPLLAERIAELVAEGLGCLSASASESVAQVG